MYLRFDNAAEVKNKDIAILFFEAIQLGSPAEDFFHFPRVVNIPIEFIAQHDNSCGVFDQPHKRSISSMPLAIVVHYGVAVINEQPPREPVVMHGMVFVA